MRYVMRMELKNHTHTVEKPVKSIFQLPNEKRNKKSTIINLILQNIKPTSGTIKIDNEKRKEYKNWYDYR